MNNEEREILFKEKFTELPKTIQTAIVNSNWLMKVRVISSRNGLLLDQAANIENIVFSTMLGFFHPDQVLKNIIDAGIKQPVAEKIIKEIDEQIFAPIKTDLVNTYNKFEQEDTEEGDNSLDILAGASAKPIVNEIHDDLPENREALLKEIEDADEVSTLPTVEVQSHELGNPMPTEINPLKPEPTLEIETKTTTPATISATVSTTAPTTSAQKPNPFAQKLTETVSNQPQSVKIDPYREPIE